MVASRARPDRTGGTAGLEPAGSRVDLDDAKGVIELICRRLGYPPPAYTPLTDDPNLHPGRSARVAAGGHVVGRVGEVHPATIEALDLRAEVVLVAELAIEGLAGGQIRPPSVAAPSHQPSVERDLAVIVVEDRPAAEVEAAIVRHGGALLRHVSLFDVYRGRPLARRSKSWESESCFTSVRHSFDWSMAESSARYPSAA